MKKASVSGHREVGKTNWPNLPRGAQWSQDDVDQGAGERSVKGWLV